MKNCAVIATHHKTGTVWMRGIFQRIAKSLGLRCILLDGRLVPEPSDLCAPVIAVDYHSDFRNCRWLLDKPECRLLHLIRDPRDIVISAAHYHRTAEEPWLHWRERKFKGLTYQQAINRLADDHARYMFEMENSAERTIGEMRRWNYALPSSLEYRYEDLIADADTSLFRRALVHLGFESGELDVCCGIFRQMSIDTAGTTKPSGHVRSGKIRQWADVFDVELATAFINRFDNVLIELGYEADNSWLKLLPQRRDLGANDEMAILGDHAISSDLPA